MLTAPGRFKSWILVRLRGLPPDQQGGTWAKRWKLAARIYRDRAINTMGGLQMEMEGVRALQQAFDEKDDRRLLRLLRAGALVATGPYPGLSNRTRARGAGGQDQMTRYRVTGTLLGSYAPRYEETDRIDLDLIVPATSAAWAEGEARMIAARDYD